VGTLKLLTVSSNPNCLTIGCHKRREQRQSIRPADIPRSYQVETDTGTLRHNRRQLTRKPEQQETIEVQCNQDVSSAETETTPEPNSTKGHELVTARCGRLSKPPKRLIQETD